MERTLLDFQGGSGADESDDRLQRAQELCWDAFDSDDPQEQIELAQKSLVISPDCADAYTILAEHAASRKEAADLCREALAAAERALGPEFIEREAGLFWGLMETRPYMRARQALAEQLWLIGRRDVAIDHLQEMLRLNPTDNQGMRYVLASHLAEQGRDDELDELLRRYDREEFAFWKFFRTLLSFRREGGSERTCKLLAQARGCNPYVVPALLGIEQIESEMPGFYSHGAPSEAEVYVQDLAGGWRQTPGAITWLRRIAAAGRKPKKGPRTVGPTAAVKGQLKKLAQRFGIAWQALVQQVPTWIQEDDAFVRPWSILLVEPESRFVISQELLAHEPTPEVLFDHLARMMKSPPDGSPGRPSEIQVRESPLWAAVSPHLEEIGVDCIYREELEEIDQIFEDMRKVAFDKGGLPGLLDLPGISPARAEDCFAAASEFYRAAPWRKLGVETPLRVECDAFGPGRAGPWYAMPMGQSNQTFGLAIYDDLESIRALLAGCCDSEHECQEPTCFSTLFGEVFEIPVSDLLALERHSWPIAGPEAYPTFVRLARDRSFRRPEPWELELMTACLRAVTQFAATYEDEHPEPRTLTVRTSQGERTVVLTAVCDLLDGGKCGSCECE